MILNKGGRLTLQFSSQVLVTNSKAAFGQHLSFQLVAEGTVIDLMSSKAGKCLIHSDDFPV